VRRNNLAIRQLNITHNNENLINFKPICQWQARKIKKKNRKRQNRLQAQLH